MAAKKKRTAKQLANDKRLGKLAKARAKKKCPAKKKKATKKKATKKKATRKKAAKKTVKKRAVKKTSTRKKAAKKTTKRKTGVVSRKTLADGSKWELRTSGQWVPVKGPSKRKATKKKATRKKAAKKTTKKASKKTAKRVEKPVTLKSILSGAIPQPRGANLQAKWICAGPTRTGCGGGKAVGRGSRVIGILS